VTLPDGFTLDEPMKADAGIASLPKGFTIDQPVVSSDIQSGLPEGFTLDSPPERTSAPESAGVSLSATSNAPGVLPLTEDQTPGGQAFKAKLQADAMKKAQEDGGYTHSLTGAAMAGLTGSGLGRKLAQAIEPFSGEDFRKRAQSAPGYTPEGMAEKVAYGAGQFFGGAPILAAGGTVLGAVGKAIGLTGKALGLTEAAGAGAALGASGPILEPEQAKEQGLTVLGEAVKGAVTMGPTAFLPGAKSVLGAVTKRAPSMAATLAASTALYDHFVRGAPLDLSETIKQTGEEIPTFVLLEAIASLGKMPLLPKGRLGNATSPVAGNEQLPEVPQPTIQQEIAMRTGGLARPQDRAMDVPGEHWNRLQEELDAQKVSDLHEAVAEGTESPTIAPKVEPSPPIAEQPVVAPEVTQEPLIATEEAVNPVPVRPEETIQSEVGATKSDGIANKEWTPVTDSESSSMGISKSDADKANGLMAFAKMTERVGKRMDEFLASKGMTKQDLPKRGSNAGNKLNEEWRAWDKSNPEPPHEGTDIPRNAEGEPDYRTVINEAPKGEKNKALWIVRKVLGGNADVNIVGRIFERGAERLGKYQKGLVTIAEKGDMDRTAWHEAHHGAEDMLMTKAERDSMAKIEPDAEKRADAFMEYAMGKQGIKGSLVNYFNRMMYRIKKLFGAAKGIDELKSMHARLMQGKLAERGLNMHNALGLNSIKDAVSSGKLPKGSYDEAVKVIDLAAKKHGLDISFEHSSEKKSIDLRAPEGRNYFKLLGKTDAEIAKEAEKNPIRMAMGSNRQYDIRNDGKGRYTITLYDGAKPSTVFHEFVHIADKANGIKPTRDGGSLEQRADKFSALHLEGKDVSGEWPVVDNTVQYRTPIKADITDPVLQSAVDKTNQNDVDVQTALNGPKSLTRGRKIQDALGVQLIDQSHPIVRRVLDASRDLGAKFLHSLKAEKHMVAQAERRLSGLADTIESHGIKTPLEKKELETYLHAKRDLALYNDPKQDPDFKSPYTKEEAEKLIEMFENRHPKSGALKKSAQSVQDEFNKSTDLLFESGVITDEARKAMQKNFYMPRWFIDKFDPIVGETSTRNGKFGVRNSGIKELKQGSEGTRVSDMMTLISQNMISAESIAQKNKTMRALKDVVDKTSPAKRTDTDLDVHELAGHPDPKTGKMVYAEPKPGFERVDYFVDGQKRALEVRKDLAQALTYTPAIDPSTANIISWITGTKPLKFMATAGNVEFALGNIPRDWGLQYLAGDSWSSFIPKAIAQQLMQAGKLSISKSLKNKLRDGYYKYGGETGWLSSSEILNSSSKDPKLLAAQGAVKKAMNALSYVGNKSEELSRLMNVNQELKKMGTDAFKATDAQWAEAVHKARSIMDFSDHGRLVKTLDSMIPFLNPSFQGARAIGKAFIDRPVQTTMKAAQLVAGATALYYYARKNDEQGLDSISKGDMMSKLNIPLGATSEKDGEKQHAYVGIPIDQGWRPFVVLGKLLADKLHGKEVDPSILNSTILANYVPGDINNIPPVIAALQAYANNFDMWKGDKIWKGRDVSPEMEYTARTPDRYVKAGEITGLSPERLRVAESKILPNNPLIWARDKAFDMFSGETKAQVQKDMWQELADLPGSRKYIRLTSPRGLTETQEKTAKRLGVSTKDRAEQRVFEEINAKEKAIGSARQKNDVTFDKLVARVRSGELPKSEIYKEAFKVKNEKGEYDNKERKRILRNLKRKYPKVGIVAPKGED
jgi:hypothetical protein